ncbi:MAG: acyl--CoA ligase, partial [Congregibacter sp.]|nr:acyl--CoA ligase [Congregibacter sp.]
MNLADITAKWADLDPEREALIDTTTKERMTFGVLHDKSTRLANAWRAAGLSKGDRVAVLAKNSIDYFIVYFACARAGLI